MRLPQEVSNNKAQVCEIYAQIDGIADSLERAVPDVTVLTPATQEAIQALAKYMRFHPSLKP